MRLPGLLSRITMVSTRSASGLPPLPQQTATAASRPKRKAAPELSTTKSIQKKVRTAVELATTIPPDTASLVPNGTNTTPLVPAVLSFDFEEGKRHLITADARFEDVFSRMKCKPFEQLEQVHPFRALATSILGQQISWIAACAINHKFIRLFEQTIPENLVDYAENDSPTSFFPSPQQVVATDLATLRTAGLSGRKAEYIRDLAARFSDGRLSTEKLLKATDEELSEMLIEIYGVGKWTVDMFSIFAMRRPNILPVADLGVQRGVLRWFLSLHSPAYSINVSPEKSAEEKKAEAKATPKGKGKGKGKKGKTEANEDALPVFGEASGTPPENTADDGKIEANEDALPVFGEASGTPPENTADDVSSVPPGPMSVSPLKDSRNPAEEVSAHAKLASMPTPFTPSINRTLNAVKGSNPPPLPDGLTVAILKSRLDPKKKVKGAILTPKEMEDLTEPWKPYRSLAVFYMWALQEEK